jgi:DNA-binding XRE family transcriptional regulator
MSDMTVSQYRASLKMSLETFAAEFGKSKGYFSAIEKENSCPPGLALEIEAHSKGLVDAAGLNDTIRRARRAAA